MSYILTEKSLTLHNDVDGRMLTLPNTHPSWDAAKEVLKDPGDSEATKFDKIEALINPLFGCEDFLHGYVEIKERRVLYNGKPMSNALTERMLRMRADGFDIKPLANFMDNLQRNTSNTAVEELYKFLETNDLPITPDGCFVGYKGVREDFMDAYSGKYLNKPGMHVSMPRNQVNDDSSQGCSHGLHVGAYSYFGGFGYARMLAVKVNPADVVSVPDAYAWSKMRVCAYTVLHEIEKPKYGQMEDILADRSVYDDNWKDDWEDWDDERNPYYPED